MIDLGGHPHKVTAGELQALVDAGQTDLNVRPNTTPAGPWAKPAELGFTPQVFAPPPPPPTVLPPPVPSAPVVVQAPPPVPTPEPVAPSSTTPTHASNLMDLMDSSSAAINGSAVSVAMPDGSEAHSSLQEGNGADTAATFRQTLKNVEQFFRSHPLSEKMSKDRCMQFAASLVERINSQGDTDPEVSAWISSCEFGLVVVAFQDALRSQDLHSRS